MFTLHTTYEEVAVVTVVTGVGVVLQCMKQQRIQLLHNNNGNRMSISMHFRQSL